MEESKMSLLDEAMEDCRFLNKTKSKDGYGGTITTWTEGFGFKAAIVFDTSMEARIGEKQGVTNLYTVTTGREITLEFHDVFKRLSDNKVFRVTSDGDDKKTPNSSTLNMRQVTAEEWSLTGNG
jgi:hypothetical protein